MLIQTQFSAEEMMKTVAILLFLFLGILTGYAQSPFVVTMSQSPTAEELASYFLAASAGRIEVFAVMGAIAERGDSSVAGLRDLLFSSSQHPDSMRTIKQYGLSALEAIGTERSFSVVNEVSRNCTDVQLRGIALNSLATSYYEQLIVHQWTPDREIIHAFMNHASDSTTVASLEMTVADIVHTGLLNWMGKDSWGKRTGRIRVRLAGGTSLMSMPEFREFWWQQNHVRIHWNAQQEHFDLQ